MFTFRSNRVAYRVCKVNQKIHLKPRIVSLYSTDKQDVVKPISEIPPHNPLFKIPKIGYMFLFKPFTKLSYSEPEKIWDLLLEKYGDIVRLTFNKANIVAVSHPDYARKVMQANYEVHKRFKFPMVVEASKKSGAVKDLGQLDGKEWADRRRPAQEKMLRPAVVASYVPLIEKVTNDFVAKLKTKSEIEDLYSELSNYATESVGMLCFNERLGCLESTTSHPVTPVMRSFFDIMQKSIRQPDPKSKVYRELYEQFTKDATVFREIAHEAIIKQKALLTKLEKEGKLDEYLEKEPNFLHSLLSDPRITEEEASSLVMSLFGAGIDTSANTLTFLLTELASNQDKQARLYDEIQRVVGKSDILTKEHLAQMSYLKACLKESLRKTFPIGMGVARWLESDLIVGGYLIPKDTMVLLHMKAMSGDKRFFSRPKEFLPERWLRNTTGELAEGQLYPFATKPFGFGPRSCLGQRFAEIEIFIAATKIIQNFQIAVPEDFRGVKTTVRLFTTPTEKIKLLLSDRKCI